MILSDREIWLALDKGGLKITPRPNLEVYSSTAVDLTLGGELLRWKPKGGRGGAKPTIFCPDDPEFDHQTLRNDHGETVQIPNSSHTIEPRSFHLGWTIERIQLPPYSRLAARVEGKSSLARLGIGVHITAPTIHAGFGYKENDPSYIGTPLQLEIWNVGELHIEIKKGMRICQLIFEEVRSLPDKGYSGRFHEQGPERPD